MLGNYGHGAVMGCPDMMKEILILEIEWSKGCTGNSNHYSQKQNAKDDYPYTLEKGTLEDSSVLTHGLNDIENIRVKQLKKRPK